jgi:hypothetical protein
VRAILPRVARFWWSAVSGVAALAGVGALALAAPAAASESAEVELRLTGLTGVLAPETGGDAEDAEEGADPSGLVDAVAADRRGPGEDLELRLLVHNRGGEPVDGLRIVVEVHPAVDSREELAGALDGEGPTGPAAVQQQDVRELADLAPGEVAGIEERLTREQVPWAADGGVHPVRVSVVRGAEVLDELTTAVVWLGTTDGEPLLTTVVWPLTDAPWRSESGAYPAGADRHIRPGGRLDVLLRALELHDEAGVLLAPSAHLVEDLEDLSSGFVEIERQEDGTRSRHEVLADHATARRAAETLRRIRDLAEDATHQPITGAYANADLAALLAHGDELREVAGELATEGRSRLQRDLERSVDASVFLQDAPTSPEALDLVPAQHLLLAPGVVADPPDDARIRRVRTPSGRPLTASVGDPVITELLDDGGNGLETAQRVLVETAALYFAEPDTSGRALSLHPPADWDPDPELVRALLRGLDDAYWLELVSPAQLGTRAQVAPGTIELTEPEEERLPRDVGDALATALADLEAAVESWPVDAEQTPERSRRLLRDALLRAASADINAETASAALIRDVQAELDRYFGDVEVASGSQVTLTAESGQVPVTVRRTRGGPITVRVEVESQGQLVWEQRRSDDIVLDDEEAHTVSFETRALGTGTFPVTVTVTDVTGTRELERANLRVRSTAVSGPALSATGALVLGLLLVGALRRRPRGPTLQVVDDEAT